MIFLIKTINEEKKAHSGKAPTYFRAVVFFFFPEGQISTPKANVKRPDDEQIAAKEDSLLLRGQCHP